MADFGNLGVADESELKGILVGLGLGNLNKVIGDGKPNKGAQQGANPISALAGILQQSPRPAPPSPLPASIPPQLAQLLAARSAPGGVSVPPPRPVGVF